jgi:hypothetical protein
MSKDLIKRHSEGITHNTLGSIISNYLIQGVPAATGLIAALLAYLRNGVPLYLVIIIGSGVFFLLSLAWYYLARRRLLHAAHEEPVSEPAAGSAQLAGTAGGDEQLEVDFRNLIYTHPSALFNGLTAERHISFVIGVFNGSPYDVTVEDGLRGYILMDGRPLPDKPILRVTKFAPPADRLTSVELRQDLDERTAQSLDESFREGASHQFAFTDLDIYFVARLPDRQLRQKLDLPDGVHCKAGVTSGRLHLASVRITAATHGEVSSSS